MPGADAMGDTFAWGLGIPTAARDESPTKRRRTTTQWYGQQDQQDQQQPANTPLEGLTRRNRSKTWPSAASAEQQLRSTKESLQLSPSTVAALAKDLNLMEALNLMEPEMEVHTHAQGALLSQQPMRPSTRPLAQGCSLGPGRGPLPLTCREGAAGGALAPALRFH